MTTIIMTPQCILADSLIWNDRPWGYMNKMARSRDRWWAAGAGECSIVQSFLSWFSGISVAKRRGAWLSKAMPHPWPESSGLMLLSPGGKMFFFEGYRPVEFTSKFVVEGTGAAYALGALEAGANPLQAMMIAARLDPGTGGAIEYATAGAATSNRHETYEQTRTAASFGPGSDQRPVLKGRFPILSDGANRLSPSLTAKAAPRPRN